MSTLLGLKIAIPERVVQVSDSEGFTVRGLTPLQVFSLYKRHTGELSAIFDRLMDGVRDNGIAQHADIESMVLALLGDTPILIAEMIVLGSGGNADKIDDFEAAYNIASALPFPVQVDALTKIGELTFTSDMPPGKFAALIVTLIRKTLGASKTISLEALRNGSGESGAASAS